MILLIAVKIKLSRDPDFSSLTLISKVVTWNKTDHGFLNTNVIIIIIIIIIMSIGLVLLCRNSILTFKYRIVKTSIDRVGLIYSSLD